MKFPIWRRPHTLALLLGCVLAFTRCGEETLAGSSVTTGNPTEIQVSFTGENGPTALTGRVEIYGATQVPVPGFRPEPLARIDVAGKQDVLLGADAFAGIPDSLWPAGSLEGDSLARFNLVFTGEGQGAILRDLVLRRKAGEFVVEMLTTLARQDGKQGAAEDRVARLEVGLAELVEYRAYIDPSALDTSRHNYLFVKGTGFAAIADSGIFRFAALPQGGHSVAFISLPNTRNITWPEDSAYVYATDRQMEQDLVDTLKVTDIDFQLQMPDQYKP